MSSESYCTEQGYINPCTFDLLPVILQNVLGQSALQLDPTLTS